MKPSPSVVPSAPIYRGPLPHVHAVRAHGQRHIGAVVHKQAGPSARERDGLGSERTQVRGGQ